MNGPANKQNNSPAPDPSRRGFLASALATALGVSLADLISPGELLAAPPPDCSKAGDAFVPVLEFVSKNGKLAANLTVKAIEKSIATIAGQGYQCRAMKVRYYQGEDVNNPAGKWPVNP